jgi:ribose transport system ATP-binding protein
VKAASPDDLITTLSGGNQQKVMMARCLARDPRVLVLCEPTAGVDVGTRQAIYEFIATRARAGLSLVVSSSDTGDLLALCTRVLVMCNGKVVREIAGDEITEHALVTAMEETEQE